jgi:hypothetical protein
VYSGIYLFLRGFRMLQHKRLIQNTPSSKIRSASIGLVEVSGMPKGQQIIRAGITGEPCYYYRARAWQKSDSGTRGEWKQVADETVCVPFFVDDGTGWLLVYPQGAQLDVHRNFKEEYGGSFFASRELVPESVRNFLLRHGIPPTETIRLEEQCILPGYPLFVFGTLGENPGKGPWPSAPQTGAGPSASNQHGTPIHSQPRSGAGSPASFVVKGTTKNVLTASASAGVSSGIGSMPAQMVPAGSGRTDSHSGAANQAVHPPIERNAHVGDAQEFDPHPHAAITKGEHNQLFAISSQSQTEVVLALQWQAVGCIWGGPTLALLGLYLLIVSWTSS